MSNREGLALLGFAVPAVLLGLLLDGNADWLVTVGAIGAVFGIAVLTWNQVAGARNERGKPGS